MTAYNTASALLVLISLCSTAWSQTAFSWNSPNNGSWSDQTMWSPTGLPGAQDSASLGFTDSYNVLLDISRQIDQLHFANENASVTIQSSRTLTLTSGCTGSGTLEVNNSGGAQSRLKLFDQSATSANIVLQAANYDLINFADLEGPLSSGEFAMVSGTTTGLGVISGNIHNSGTISSDNTGSVIRIVTSSPMLSTGTIQAINGGTIELNSTIQGGVLLADSASRVRMANSSSVLTNTTLVGDFLIEPGAGFYVGTGNVYNNVFRIGNGSGGQTARLKLFASSEVSADIWLKAPNSTLAQQADLEGPLTDGESATLSGLVTGTGELSGHLHNAGTIAADGVGTNIRIITSSPLTSAGTIAAINGGTVTLVSQMKGGILRADAASRVITQSSSSVVANTHLVGDFVVDPANTFYFGEQSDLDGTFTVGNRLSPTTAKLKLFAFSVLSSNVRLNAPGAQFLTSSILEGPLTAGEDAVVSGSINGTGLLTGYLDLSDATWSPGTDEAAGHIAVATENHVQLSAHSVSIFDIFGTLTTEHDQVISNSAMLLAGSCTIILHPSTTSTFGSRWDIITGSDIRDRFQAYALPESPATNEVYRVFYESDRVYVRRTCVADFDGDLLLNFFDVAGFLADFNSQDPRADLAAPFGTWNFFDVATFLGAYNAGCP